MPDETLWKGRLLLAVPTAAQTTQNRDTLADIFVNNGSLETAVNERLMFTKASVRLAAVASPLVQIGIGLSMPVKVSMRTALQTAITTINGGLTAPNRIRYYAIAAIDLPSFPAGTLIESNGLNVSAFIGQPFTLQNALNDLSLVVMD